MGVVRNFLHEGKTLQEMMEILLPIYIEEKTCNMNDEMLKYEQQNSKITCCLKYKGRDEN